jgi:hypothetical protein
MSTNFETLANAIKLKLEFRFSAEQLEDSYIYSELERIMVEWKTGKFTSAKTDIGAAAVKLFDSGLPEDDELANEICRLAEIFRRRARTDLNS